MTDDHEPEKKIADNPRSREIRDLLPAVKFLGSAAGVIGKLGIKKDAMLGFQRQVEELSSQASILDLPDRFNQAFGERGWIAVGSALSVEVMEAALEAHEENDEQRAEELLIDWFTKENIELFAITRARRFHVAQLREDQLREALSLYLEERYMAAVPLILIACDGFASDVLGTSPFEKNADLSCFDSITGHPSSLPTLIRRVTKGAYKSRDDALEVPQRHAILHGRALGYANKVVCAKAWLLMMALVDWAMDKSSEVIRLAEHERKANTSLGDALAQAKKTQDDKKIIDAFVPATLFAPFPDELDGTSPVFALQTFLSAWKGNNYGTMAKVAVNLLKKPVKKMAGEMRNTAELLELQDYEILEVHQYSVAACDARVRIRAATIRKPVEGEFRVRLIRYNHDGDIAMPTDEKASWAVQQSFIYDVMNEKLYEQKVE